MNNSTCADGATVELTAAESIALRDWIAQQIACAANELDVGSGQLYDAVGDGDRDALEHVQGAVERVRFHAGVLDKLGWPPACPDRLILDGEARRLIEESRDDAQEHLERFGGRASDGWDVLDERDWRTRIALGDRVGALL